MDGLQPDVDHQGLWVLRDGLSGEVLLARRLLSGRQQDPGSEEALDRQIPLGLEVAPEFLEGHPCPLRQIGPLRFVVNRS
jgi:hypothetical protein